ncbi:hypothetical protein T12_5367 [Trichinella patagoniensis]|uniref:Uncharacterized protein n=1 Tax=Trichinella patagoniensis TaxID=990121 RepID=A0A0V0ZXB2_9BILA|nr:hypothetical protein T12_5367 [Trichinella patagoniensis]
MARMRAEVLNAHLKRFMLKHPCTLEIVQRIQSHNYAVDPIPPTPTPQRILTAFSQRISLAAALIHASKFHRIEIWCSLMNLHSDLLVQHWRSMCDCSQYSENITTLLNCLIALDYLREKKMCRSSSALQIPKGNLTSTSRNIC